jgi:hypothetical protein
VIDLQNRVKQLDQWSTDLNMPPSVWLSGLFNPQSFLTAIMQTAARKNTWQLDKVRLSLSLCRFVSLPLSRSGFVACVLTVDVADYSEHGSDQENA